MKKPEKQKNINSKISLECIWLDGSADPFAGGGPGPALAVFVPDDSDGSEEGRGVVEGEGAEELQDALTHRLQGTRVASGWTI